MDEFESLVYSILGYNDRVEELLKLRSQINDYYISKYVDIPEEIINIEKNQILDELYNNNKIFLRKAAEILGDEDFFKLFELRVDQIDDVFLPRFGNF